MNINEFKTKTSESMKELEIQHNCEPLGEVTEPLLIININKTHNVPNTTIYDATRYCWRLNPKRANRAKYILSEYQGIVRAVFQTNEKGWQVVVPQTTKTRRHFFEGEEVLDKAVLARYLNKRVEKKRGQSNPIQYRNIK